MTLKLHAHPLSSYCWKAMIALEEAGLVYDLEIVDLGDPEASARFRQVSPFGMMPALEDTDTGLAVSEATVVIEHLARTYPSAAALVPQDWATGREVRLWDRYLDNYIHAQVQRVVFDRIRPSPEVRDPFGSDQARARLAEAYGILDARMAEREWAAGAYSLADCAASPALYYGRKIVPFDGHANVTAYFERLLARPSFAKVLEGAKPYLHFFPEEPT